MSWNTLSAMLLVDVARAAVDAAFPPSAQAANHLVHARKPHQLAQELAQARAESPRSTHMPVARNSC